MGVQKNIQFSELIRAEGRMKEFNFLRRRDDNKISYQVDVPGDREIRYQFTMQFENAEWKINTTDDLPVWIRDAETRLNEIVSMHEK